MTGLRVAAIVVLLLVLLGAVALLAARAAQFLRARRAYSRWRRPARFERNLVVIGAGAAGLVAAYIAAAVRAKVTLVERHRMGGDCLNTGCVPSKALIRSARLLAQIRRAHEYGLRTAHAEADFALIMERVRGVVRAVEPHDSVERYTALGVECLAGEARIVSPWEVEVKDSAGATRRLTTRSIVIAAGARPYVPPIPGIDSVDCLTSDTIWTLRSLPARLLVLGGGPIGCELAQAFARLGARVTLVEMLPRILAREDAEVSAQLSERFVAEGIDVRCSHKALRFGTDRGGRHLVAEHAGSEARIEFDTLLCAVGRVARTEGYGLEELGISVSVSGARTIVTDDHLRTVYPNIYACGDVAGPYQFTHTAAHQAWYAAVNALFGAVRKFRVDYSAIPRAVFTDPEVARVGLNETEAKERGVAYELSVYRLEELDRAIADGEARGMVKVLSVPGSRGGRILGATIVGEHASESIGEFVSAMRHGIRLERMLGTIHVYPTYGEANKYAAGVWKKAHAPARVLRWLDRYHAWRRR